MLGERVYDDCPWCGHAFFCGLKQGWKGKECRHTRYFHSSCCIVYVIRSGLNLNGVVKLLNMICHGEEFMPPLCQIRIPQAETGRRLDQVLALLVPEMGLRGRRRLIDTGRVVLDGTARDRAYKVRPGQMLALFPPHETKTMPVVDILVQTDAYAALSKPAGLHCQTLSGKTEPTLEDLLPTLFPQKNARLFNRLDRDTSGIVLVGFTEESHAFFRRTENECKVEKKYFAVVDGSVEAPLCLRFNLDTADRKRTKVNNDLSDDPTRFTHVLPVSYFEDERMTLVSVCIVKGARHQIRAHLAHAGHPLVNDVLYNGPIQSVLNCPSLSFYLHHHALAFPGFQVTCPVPWHWWSTFFRHCATSL